MAWIFLVELVGLASHSENGLGHSPTVRMKNSLKLYYCQGCRAETFAEHQFGMTCELCGEVNFQTLTLFTEVSRARTLALREMGEALAVSEADFLTTSQGLSKKQTRALFFSKTSQQLELVASTVSRKHLPNWGLILGGQLYQPKKLEPVTFAKDGLDLPTPTATAYGSNQGGAAGRVGKRRMSIDGMASRGLIPTPMARDWKGSGGTNRESPDLPYTMGGKLNPPFVEEIMGYQIGWTELSHWVTPWFRSKREPHL